MRKRSKILIATVLAIVLTLGLGAGAAFADDEQAPDLPAFNAQETFLTKLAENLNVTIDQLKAAVIQARTDTVVELEAQEYITEEQAERMRERIQERQEAGWDGLGMGGFGMDSQNGHHRGHGRQDGGGHFGNCPQGSTSPWSQ